LTVEEHLLFYARLKGVPIEDEEKAVQQAIAEVALQNFRTRLSKGLSGGEKRRLSIAIALIGNPGVVFLDEPTVSHTGKNTSSAVIYSHYLFHNRQDLIQK
jgi:ABC-type multidrug transport system ATPase subunit